jgi:hypothetical protein
MEAFEAAVAEPQSTPEPLSWLWRTSLGGSKEKHQPF